MMDNYKAIILADSSVNDKHRLTTMQATFPRIVLAEFNTHRMLSKNSASSRAIPVEKMISMVRDNPYVTSEWGTDQKGMQAGKNLNEDDAELATVYWLEARNNAIYKAEKLLALGVHKQLTNRLLEPFMWHTAIVSATDWSNFFNLRCHPAAHPDIRKIAENMRAALAASEPKDLTHRGWHLPLTTQDDGCLSPDDQRKVSVGRCARVSYLTHDGKRDPSADIALYLQLLIAGNMSPFEHVARPATVQEIAMSQNRNFGNFKGWVQLRKIIRGEEDMLKDRSSRL